MTELPTSSSRPAIRCRTIGPWWTTNLRSRLGMSMQALQSQLEAWPMSRSRRRNAK